MQEYVVLKELWLEFCSEYTGAMYISKIAHTTKEVDNDNIRITFSDNEGYQMLYNFLQTKKH